MSTPVVLDCDPGHDDAIALLLALASPELELLGVTTTYGNQTLEKTTANALRVLELVGRSDVPVAAGADRPLERELVVAAHVHGESGLDGPALPEATGAPTSDDAVAFIAEQLVAASAPVTIVATGPLTNVEGNFTPAAEFNIWCDPEAAAAVFASGLEVTMLGLDVTHQALLRPDVEERLRAVGRIGSFVADLNVFLTRYHRETYGWDGAPIHDAVAVAHAIRPELVQTRLRNVQVELESELCRGRTVVDLWRRTDDEPNAHVGVGIDAEGFFELLVERIGSLD